MNGLWLAACFVELELGNKDLSKAIVVFVFFGDCYRMLTSVTEVGIYSLCRSGL